MLNSRVATSEDVKTALEAWMRAVLAGHATVEIEELLEYLQVIADQAVGQIRIELGIGE